jgi:hypothetical protein
LSAKAIEGENRNTKEWERLEDENEEKEVK